MRITAAAKETTPGRTTKISTDNSFAQQQQQYTYAHHQLEAE
jgi:hypothetical protein